MAQGVPVEAHKRAEVLTLLRDGVSRNEIARLTGVSTASVSRIAKDAGLSFDRSQTQAATKARTIDLAAGRVRLAEKMLAASEAMVDRIDDPYLVYNFGGKDNDYNEHTLDSAPIEVRRSIIVTAGITFDKLTRIVERSDSGLEHAAGVLDQIAEGFAAAADRYRAEVTTDED